MNFDATIKFSVQLSKFYYKSYDFWCKYQNFNTTLQIFNASQVKKSTIHKKITIQDLINRKMEYETKAYLTTILATYIVPICLGLGMTLETANAFVGLIVCLVPMIASMLSEMWESKHLSRPKPVMDDDVEPVGVVLDDSVEDSPVYESEYVEMSNLGDEIA